MNPVKKVASCWLLLAIVGLGLSACASKTSYVVLLENEDGTTGKVQVTGREGTTVLEKKREGTVIGGEAGKVFPVSDEKISQDFGVAMAAAPRNPVSFLLYFESGGAKLTAKSEADIPLIVEEVGKRPAPDISAIGHTDTAGDDDANERLGIKRAQFVADMIANTKVKVVQISVESHGEKNLLVPTPDNTPEPRNRRVEVTVR